MAKSKPVGVRWNPELVEKFQKKYGVMSYQKMLDKMFDLALPSTPLPNQKLANELTASITKPLSLEERIRLAELKEREGKIQ